MMSDFFVPFLVVELFFVSLVALFPALLEFPRQFYPYFVETSVTVYQSIDEIDHLIENLLDDGLSQFAFGYRS